MNLDHSYVPYGDCLICGEPITQKENKPIDCYNPECIKERKSMILPEGWTLTPFEKSFKLSP